MDKDYKKLYEETLERARSMHEQGMSAERLEYIFPELRESEDERIRKEIIQFLQLPHPQFVGKRNHKEWIAWLEKQKEIKTEDFGEFIDRLSKQFPEVSFAKLSRIAVRVKNWFEKQGEQKHKIQPKFKIGDIIRFKGNETLKGEVKAHKIVGYDNELYVFADGTTDLFSEQDLYELVEQNSAWNAEDENMFKSLNKLLNEVSCYSCTEGVDKILNWLKSIKPNHWKPSEEQLTELRNAIISKRGPLYDLYFDLEKLFES